MALFDASTTSHSISLSHEDWDRNYSIVNTAPILPGWSAVAATSTQFAEVQQDNGLRAVWDGSGLSYTFFADPLDRLIVETLSGTLDAISLLQADGQAVYRITGFSYQALDLDAGHGGFQLLRGIFAGNDTLKSGAGDDWLAGYGGNDRFVAGLGDDTIVSGWGNDTIDGGQGFDTVSYGHYLWDAYERAHLVVEFDERGTAIATSTGKGTDTLFGIEAVIGGSGDDRIQGHATAAVHNLFEGGHGNDTIDGGAGNDTIDGGTGWSVLSGGSGVDVLSFASYPRGGLADWSQIDMARGRFQFSGTGYEITAGLFTGFENVQGSQGRDVIHGNAEANLIDGGWSEDKLGGRAGNDTLRGDYGHDTLDGGLGDDLLIGGADNDTYVVDSLGDVVREEASGGIDTVIAAVDGLTLQGHVENLSLSATLASVLSGTGNALANRLQGNRFDNRLSGLDGHDTLYGGDGSDTLLGGAGNDLLHGGAGNNLLDGGDGIDTVYAAGTVDLSRGIAQSATGSDRLVNIENAAGSHESDDLLIGNDGNNRLYGRGGNDTLRGGTGDDTLLGGDGNDSIDGGDGEDILSYWLSEYEFSEKSLTIDLSLTTAQDTGAGVLTIVNIEHLIGGQTHDRLTGNAGNNRLDGGDLSGNDTLDGAGGNDSLYGRAGLDQLDGGAGNDWLRGGEGGDILTGGSGSDTFVLDRRNPSAFEAADRVTDFVSGTDRIAVSMATTGIGDQDRSIEGAQTRSSPGGFSAAAELVLFTQDIATPTSASAAAAAIGRAASAYAAGDARLFVVDNGSGTSAVYLFTSSGADAAVTGDELLLLAEVHSAAGATAVADYRFVA